MSLLTITDPAPRSPVGPDGRPAFGAFSGYAADVQWDALAPTLARNRVWRALHTKTWQYASITTDTCVTALAVIDVGYATSAFAYVFDRAARELRANLSFTGLPRTAIFSAHAGPGSVARFAGRGSHFAIARAHGENAWRLEAKGPGYALDATLDARGAPPALCAVAPIAGGVANCTHKTVGLAARGVVTAHGQRFDLAGGVGALDHTHGLLARDTRWRWASASSRALSLNLVEGFNGPVENVVWIGDELVPVGAVTFDYDRKHTSRPWRIHAADGSLELEFRPEGERREDKNLIVAKSWYVQPIGTFHGVLRLPGRPLIEVHDLAGVTEDHVARW